MLGVRSKTIIAIVGVILTISGSYFLFFVQHREHSRQMVIQSKKELVTALVALRTRELNNQYVARIKSFVFRNKQAVEFFAARDRDLLYETMLPLYEILQKEDPHFNHINFILPDDTVFLRVHQPDAHGDKEPFYCRLYSELGNDHESESSGFVFGKCGLMFRVAQPLFHDKEYIGSVLFGIRIGTFIDDIKGFGMHTALALRNDLADQFEEGADKGIVSGDYILFAGDDPFFTYEAKNIRLDEEQQKIVHDDAMHLVFSSYVLQDIEGNEFGRILQGIDLTDIIVSYRKGIVSLSIITLGVLLLASCILYFAFSKLLSELVSLNERLEEKNRELTAAGQHLEAQVLKRTSELAEANTQLIREIEERKSANISLVRSIEEWQSTFDAIADPVTILDADLEVVVANRAAQRMLSNDGREIVGRTCYELFAGESEPCESCPSQEIFTTGVKKEYEVEHEYLGRSLLVSCSPIYDGDEVSGYVHTAKDITEEKILKRQLSQAQKMEAIATLAGGIAHDFNNILGAILGNADLLLYRLATPPAGHEEIKMPSPGDISSHLEAIKKAGNRAKELVSQILAFSRQSKTQRQNVLITPVVKEGVKLLRSSLAANIEITSTVDQNVCHINADLSQVHQVLMNLCTNAAQAMAEKGGVLDVSLGNLEITAASRLRYPDVPSGTYLALAVKDTGHGIPPEIMERIFDPFFTTRDVGEGTGMGLSVIHGIITAHRGYLDVRSRVDAGSEFTVFFPCVHSGMELDEDPVLGVPRGKEKILFVDDEFEIVKMSATMLQYLGYTVVSATSGDQALEMLRGNEADAELVICDYSMPGMSGTELAAEIIQVRKDIPVILCSGFSESVVLDDKAKKVIRKFMSKPLDMKKLAIAIREVLT